MVTFLTEKQRQLVLETLKGTKNPTKWQIERAINEAVKKTMPLMDWSVRA